MTKEAAMEEYMFSQGKAMRCGYTTGSCAAAAAKAAAVMVLGRQRLDQVILHTPRGMDLSLRPEDVRFGPQSVSCAIRKDSGDDPDITDGMLVYAEVVLKEKSGVELLGGSGVGTVTKAGLSCPVGGPAINPVPRAMITKALQEAAAAYDYGGGFTVTISLPKGEELAKKTFNPRLGITGGLSILGTTGIVEPMSDQAIVATMQVEMRSRKAEGCRDLLAVFGNYGQDFCRDALHMDISKAVTCSNFVGDLLDYAVYCGFSSLLLIGHSGKLIKLAQGVMNTHSKYADARMEALALWAIFSGAGETLGKQVYESPTTDEALRILREGGWERKVLPHIMEKIDFYMEHRVHGALQTGAIMFSNTYGVLGMTKNAAALLEKQQVCK